MNLKISVSSLLKLCFGAAVLVSSLPAMAEPLKVAIIESLSGPVESVGRPFAQAAQYAIDEMNQQGGYNGAPIWVKQYDSQSTPAGASEQFRAAISDGARIILQGASSVMAGQLSDETKRYNLRNPGKEVIHYNIGSEAADLTAEKCHFWFFRLGTSPEIRWNAIIPVLQSQGVLKNKAFLINQNYSYGLSVQKAQQRILADYKIGIVGDVIHDLNKVQDFSPYVQQIKSSGAEAVLTGNGFNDMILLVRGIRDASLPVALAGITLDAPGTLKVTGEAALGYYNVTPFSPEIGGERTTQWMTAFRQKVGRDPFSYDSIGYNAIQLLNAALKQADFKGGPIDILKIALAIENASVDTPMGKQSMRKEDHQTIVPIIVSKVSKAAKIKVDGTDMGLEVVAQVPGDKAAIPVDAACKMQRPN